MTRLAPASLRPVSPQRGIPVGRGQQGSPFRPNPPPGDQSAPTSVLEPSLDRTSQRRADPRPLPRPSWASLRLALRPKDVDRPPRSPPSTARATCAARSAWTRPFALLERWLDRRRVLGISGRRRLGAIIGRARAPTQARGDPLNARRAGVGRARPARPSGTAQSIPGILRVSRRHLREPSQDRRRLPSQAPPSKGAP